MLLVPRWEQDLPRERWALESGCAQATLLSAAATFVNEAETALEELEGGVEDALTIYMEVTLSRRSPHEEGSLSYGALLFSRRRCF